MTQKSVADWFEDFWRVYPARPRNPKAAAGAVFARLVRAGTPAADIVGAAERYAAEVRRDKVDPLFVPHARTWLSQRRDLDYPAPAEAPSAPAAPDRAGLWPRLATVMTEPEYRSWIAPCAVSLADTGATIVAPSRFHAAQLRGRWEDALLRGLGVARLIIEIEERRP